MTMSIEEYRDHLYTEKEEWNNFYNPKRCSIEALIKIEVKQRGQGPVKKIYTTTTNEPGPYYDPYFLHTHIWKKTTLIKNFESEQNPKVPFVEFTNVKQGIFCCICHLKNNKKSFASWVVRTIRGIFRRRWAKRRVRGLSGPGTYRERRR